MSLTLQKRLAAELLKCGESRVRFDEERLDEIEAAISREEIKRLIEDGAIYKIQEKGISKGRLRERKKRKGPG
ncbi:MAG: 50S ribosomal protein L19e, partial [Nitrososphaerota archaeon]